LIFKKKFLLVNILLRAGIVFLIKKLLSRWKKGWRLFFSPRSTRMIPEKLKTGLKHGKKSPKEKVWQ